MHQEMDRVIPRIAVARRRPLTRPRSPLARSFSANCSFPPPDVRDRVRRRRCGGGIDNCPRCTDGAHTALRPTYGSDIVETSCVEWSVNGVVPRNPPH